MGKVLKKVITKSLLLFSMVVILGSSVALNIKASTPPFSAYVYGEVADNGVRLRQSPVNGAVLELMYKNEVVWVDLSTSQISGFLHLQRDKTGTVGYASSNLIIIY